MVKDWKKSSYERLEDILKYPANKIVHAWNCASGETKSTLANILMVPGVFYGASRPITPQNYKYATAFLAIFPIVKGIGNFLHDKDETNLLQNGLKSVDVELHRWMNRLLTMAGCIVAATLYSEGDQVVKEVEFLGYPVWLWYTASFYVMTADSLPPRKSAIAKAKDKLVDIINSHRRKPAYETNSILAKAPNPLHAY